MEPDGGKRWRLAYRFAGKQKVLAIGVYPAVGLPEARDARDEAKRLLSEGQETPPSLESSPRPFRRLHRPIPSLPLPTNFSKRSG